MFPKDPYWHKDMSAVEGTHQLGANWERQPGTPMFPVVVQLWRDMLGRAIILGVPYLCFETVGVPDCGCLGLCPGLWVSKNVFAADDAGRGRLIMGVPD